MASSSAPSSTGGWSCGSPGAESVVGLREAFEAGAHYVFAGPLVGEDFASLSFRGQRRHNYVTHGARAPRLVAKLEKRPSVSIR